MLVSKIAQRYQPRSPSDLGIFLFYLANPSPTSNHHNKFILCCLDGHLVLGCCDLTGRLWTGSIWYYRDPKDAPSVQKALTGVDCDSGCVDGKFIGDRTKNVSGT